jgi:drug/metabolite transporter (DMT)-like permease
MLPKHPLLKGSLIVCTAFFIHATFSIAIKAARQNISVFQVNIARYLLGALLIYIYSLCKGTLPAIRITGNWSMNFARALLGLLGGICFFFSLKYIPVAEAQALFFSCPLMLAVFARVFLKENIPFLRGLAIFLGIIGVFIVLDPGKGILSWYALIILIGCFFAALCDIIVKLLSRYQNSEATVFSFLSLGAFFLIPTLPFTWKNPGYADTFLLFYIGLSGLFFQILFTKALETLPANLVAPYAYTSLIWCILLGYLFFNELPTFYDIIGSLFIFADGFLTLLSTRKLSLHSTK